MDNKFINDFGYENYICIIGNAEVVFTLMDSEIKSDCYKSANIHFHQYYELHCVISGDIQLTDYGGTHNLTAGDICVIPPLDAHNCKVECDEDGLFPHRIAIRMSFMPAKEKSDKLFSEYEYYKSIFDFIKVVSVFHSDLIKSYASQIIKFYDEAPDYAYHRIITIFSALFCELGSCIQHSDIVQHSQKSSYRDTDTLFKCDDDRYRIMIIENYIIECYMNSNGIEELMLLLHLSRRQTDRVVKQLMKNSFHELIVKQRMLRAKELIESGVNSLGDISEKVGYRSYSGFYSAYCSFFGTAPQIAMR